jgi:hypothetical protein
LRIADCGFIEPEDLAFIVAPLHETGRRLSIRNPQSEGPRPSIFDLLSIFDLVYYIGGSAAQTWAGNYLTNNGDRIGLE